MTSLRAGAGPVAYERASARACAKGWAGGDVRWSGTCEMPSGFAGTSMGAHAHVPCVRARGRASRASAWLHLEPCAAARSAQRAGGRAAIARTRAPLPAGKAGEEGHVCVCVCGVGEGGWVGAEQGWAPGRHLHAGPRGCQSPAEGPAPPDLSAADAADAARVLARSRGRAHARERGAAGRLRTSNRRRQPSDEEQRRRPAHARVTRVSGPPSRSRCCRPLANPTPHAVPSHPSHARARTPGTEHGTHTHTHTHTRTHTRTPTRTRTHAHTHTRTHAHTHTRARARAARRALGERRAIKTHAIARAEEYLAGGRGRQTPRRRGIAASPASPGVPSSYPV